MGISSFVAPVTISHLANGNIETGSIGMLAAAGGMAFAISHLRKGFKGINELAENSTQTDTEKTV